jgi:hypothetical protein
MNLVMVVGATRAGIMAGRWGPTASPAGVYSRTCAIAVAMSRADVVWWAELARQTISTLLAELGASNSPVVVGKTAAWIQEVAR